jgi:nitroreductase
MEAIEKRRSIRKYRPDAIPDAVLAKLLNALRLAPSGSNRQPWKFILVQKKETKEKLAAACRYTTPGGNLIVQKWIAEAPVVIVACGSLKDAAAKCYHEGELFISNGQVVIEEMGRGPGEYESSMPWDLAIALDHLSLIAVEEGVGTCWIGGFNGDAVQELLSIPDDISAHLIMSVGYPALSWPDPRARKHLEDIICYDKYN